MSQLFKGGAPALAALVVALDIPPAKVHTFPQAQCTCVTFDFPLSRVNLEHTTVAVYSYITSYEYSKHHASCVTYPGRTRGLSVLTSCLSNCGKAIAHFDLSNTIFFSMQIYHRSTYEYVRVFIPEGMYK